MRLQVRLIFSQNRKKPAGCAIPHRVAVACLEPEQKLTLLGQLGRNQPGQLEEKGG